MGKEQRTDERFEHYGRVDAQDLCLFPGVLDDISLRGCRVRFPVPVALDTESEYAMSFTVAQGLSVTSLRLLCQPQWQQRHDSETEIGFRILRSPDTHRLERYIDRLQEEASEGDDIYELIIKTKPRFALY